MPKAIDLKGKVFGRLRVLQEADRRNGKRRWICGCSCGKTITAFGEALASGNSTSCGCKRIESIVKSNKHRKKITGDLHSPEWQSWRAMMARCYDQNNIAYGRYGGVGIEVCKHLKRGPADLIHSIGLRPNGKSLDRMNNKAGYHCGFCPECIERKRPCNIRWATGIEQGRNQRTNHMVTIGGLTKCVSEWAEFSDLRDYVIRDRIRRGWTSEHLLLPVK